MKLLNTGVGLFLIFLLGACATASGPIKAYDESAGIDAAQLSRIYLPPEIEVEAVDGVEKDTPYITEGLNEIHLMPGTHEITIKYAKYWGDDVSGSIVKSDPVTLRLEARAGAEYVLKFPAVRDSWEAGVMVQKFKPWLVDKKGTRLAVKEVKSNVIPATPSQPAAGTALSAEEIVSRQDPLKKLQFWWKLADKKDRKAFRRWIVEN